MNRYIGIDDLAANALIELMKLNETNRRVSLQSLYNYGTVIVRLLSRPGQDAILFLTKESTNEFVDNYRDYFSIVNEAGTEYLELNKDKTIDDLRNQFRVNLTVDMAKALIEREALEILKI